MQPPPPFLVLPVFPYLDIYMINWIKPLCGTWYNFSGIYSKHKTNCKEILNLLGRFVVGIAIVIVTLKISFCIAGHSKMNEYIDSVGNQILMYQKTKIWIKNK